MEQNQPWYLRFWGTWLIVTFLYLVLVTFTGGSFMPQNAFSAFVGLFVPLGVFSTLSLVQALGFWNGALVLGLLIFTFWKADAVAIRWDFAQGGQKTVFNLGWLLILTFATDLLLFGSWNSAGIFLHFFGVGSFNTSF